MTVAATAVTSMATRHRAWTSRDRTAMATASATSATTAARYHKGAGRNTEDWSTPCRFAKGASCGSEGCRPRLRRGSGPLPRRRGGGARRRFRRARRHGIWPPGLPLLLRRDPGEDGEVLGLLDAQFAALDAE